MPNPAPAAYTFVPWVRRGLASLVKGAASNYFASLPVSLVVNGAAQPAPTVRLLGPGDITSLDARAVIRTDPRDGADAFEPNYMAMVELGLPDLPWIFTPSEPASGRLQPWICLVVLPDTDGVSLQTRPNGPAILRIGSPLDPLAELPDLTQIDFWAHAQVVGDSLSGAALNAALDGDPAATLSRLIAPRLLDPGRSYIACIVPTFRAGVNAGLGLPVDDTDLTPAWSAASTPPVTLPVYYSFRFQTGPDGDFASLARRIVPPATALDVGTRSMDASQPGFGVSPIPGVTLGLEGALQSVGGQSTPWPAGKQAPYEAALRKSVVPPVATQDPVVSPPLYGRTQSGSDLPAATPGATPVWLGELNLDPRTRAAASAGAQVVQRDQEALVASAWDQLGEIRKANQLLRQAQLARQVSASMGQRHLDNISDDGAYLQVTAPAHDRVLLSGITLSSAVAASRLPVRSVSPVLRRVARVRGPIGRRVYAATTPRLVDRLNLDPGSTSAVTPAGPVTAPRGMVALDDISPAIRVAKMTPAVVRGVGGWINISASPGGGTASLAAPIGGEGGPGPAGGGGGTTPPPPPPPKPIIDWNTDPDVPDFFKGASANLPAPFVFPSNTTDMGHTQDAFRTVASSVGGYLNTGVPQFPDPPPLAGSSTLTSTRAQLRARLDPESTIAARFRSRIPLGTGPDPLQPLIAGPSFPQAMFAPLAGLSSEWMLPGISAVPMDCATLLETNARFVEAFLVGLNEELARELLWREFPLGLTATYFRNFWGASGGTAPDIPAIGDFDPHGRLGDHTADHSSGNRIVLFVRATLFRRYPNAVVSAIPAVRNSDGKTQGLGAPRQYPVFRGEIGPDVTFFGFDNVTDPRGTTNPADQRPGWFFAIEEHSSEPRFGLEPETSNPSTATWNDLRWSEVTLSHAFLDPSATPATPVREGVSWGQSPASMAFILMRRPIRVALHGRALIPEEGA